MAAERILTENARPDRRAAAFMHIRMRRGKMYFVLDFADFRMWNSTVAVVAGC